MVLKGHVCTHGRCGVSRGIVLPTCVLPPLLAMHNGTVGSESIAMFGGFGLVAVWCFTVWKSHLALQRESKVLLLGFLMGFSSYNLN